MYKMKNDTMNMKRTALVVGQTYKNKNGTTYKCIGDHKDGGGYVMPVSNQWMDFALLYTEIWMYDNGEMNGITSQTNSRMMFLFTSAI